MFRAEYQKMRLVNPPPQLSKLTHHPSYLSFHPSFHSVKKKKTQMFPPKPPRLHQAFQSHLCKLIELTKVTTFVASGPMVGLFLIQKTGEIRPVEETPGGIPTKTGEKLGTLKVSTGWRNTWKHPWGFYNFEFPKEWWEDSESGTSWLIAVQFVPQVVQKLHLQM